MAFGTAEKSCRIPRFVAFFLNINVRQLDQDRFNATHAAFGVSVRLETSLVVDRLEFKQLLVKIYCVKTGNQI